MTYVAIICSCLLFFSSCEHNPSSAEIAVLKQRTEKDLQFKSDLSPLSKSERKNFTGLKYYPYNDDFNVLAKFEAYVKRDTIQMPTTRGLKKSYTRWGEVIFSIYGKEHRLTLLKMANPKYTFFFLPFKDKTTAEETYYTGRYMEIEMANDTARIDFNVAYNPWCNYSENYNCPIPVSFNELDIAVEAGEKIYPMKK